MNYFQNKSAPSNEYLWNLINWQSAKRILEVGSNSGNRIFEKATQFPEKQFIGVDINKEAVEVGNSEASKRDLRNITFLQFDIRSRHFSTFMKAQQFDVILSWACLIYIHPFQIQRILTLLLASTTNLILIEQNENRFIHSIVTGGTNWKHNYIYMINRISNHKRDRFNLEFHNVPKEVWNPGGGDATCLVISRILT